MALYKELLLPSGAIASYHKITKIMIIPEFKAEISLDSFLSEESRRNNKSSLLKRNYVFNYKDWEKDFKSDKLITCFYKLLKKMDDYKTAVDV